MAEPQPPFPGADRIRSLTDQDSIFRAFDAYPWTKDSAFLVSIFSSLCDLLKLPCPSHLVNTYISNSYTHPHTTVHTISIRLPLTSNSHPPQSGLRAILGAPNPSNPQNGSLRDIATHARIFYYAQRIGVQIDFAAYQTWLSQHPEYPPPHIIPSEYEQQQSSESPSASSASATAWQQAAPKADLYVDRTAQSQASGEGGEPSYPLAFAEMIKLIQEGKPIPGIRQIPNTIERDSVSLSCSPKPSSCA